VSVVLDRTGTEQYRRYSPGDQVPGVAAGVESNRTGLDACVGGGGDGPFDEWVVGVDLGGTDGQPPVDLDLDVGGVVVGQSRPDGLA
jgi:hypothetical protein